jgi:hypothetical protein
MGLPDACLTTNPAAVLAVAQDDMPPVWSSAQTTCDATFSRDTNRDKRSAEHWHIVATAPHAGYLVLHLRSFAAWRVKVNGELATSLPRREDGLMALPVPQGPVDITVDWSTTSDEVAGRSLSVLALALITCLYLAERKMGLSERKPAPAEGETAKPRLS